MPFAYKFEMQGEHSHRQIRCKHAKARNVIKSAHLTANRECHAHLSLAFAA